MESHVSLTINSFIGAVDREIQCPNKINVMYMSMLLEQMKKDLDEAFNSTKKCKHIDPTDKEREKALRILAGDKFWKRIPHSKNAYYVSKDGQVIRINSNLSINNMSIRRPNRTSIECRIAGVSHRCVQKLMLFIFVGRPDDPQKTHFRYKDRNRNNLHIDNLEWSYKKQLLH